MYLFGGYNPDDVIYLSPVKLRNKRIPEDKIGMLFCDAKGNVKCGVVEALVYELAKGSVEELERHSVPAAALCMEIAPGQSASFAIEMSLEQRRALDFITEHALKGRTTPDLLKKYPKEIIKLGENQRSGLKRRYEFGERWAYCGDTPEFSPVSTDSFERMI